MHGFDLENDNYNGVIIEPLDGVLLEESWTDVIIEKETMSRKQKIQQEVLWELLVTERNYIRRLKVITAVRLITFYINIFVIISILCEYSKKLEKV